MEYDRPWEKHREKQASCSKFALGRAPNRKICRTQTKTYETKTYRAKTYRAKTCGTQSRDDGGRTDDLEFR
jgi:hypothetical protein